MTGPIMKSIRNAEVARVFADYPARIRSRMLALRQLILTTAAATAGVGEIEECLKWGEPAYVTRNKSGSTIRLGWNKARPQQYALLVHCQTNLIDSFRSRFPGDFIFDGNRAVIFDVADDIPADQLAVCIASALTYHRTKKATTRNDRHR